MEDHCQSVKLFSALAIIEGIGEVRAVPSAANVLPESDLIAFTDLVDCNCEFTAMDE